MQCHGKCAKKLVYNLFFVQEYVRGWGTNPEQPKCFYNTSRDQICIHLTYFFPSLKHPSFTVYFIQLKTNSLYIVLLSIKYVPNYYNISINF